MACSKCLQSCSPFARVLILSGAATANREAFCEASRTRSPARFSNLFNINFGLQTLEPGYSHEPPVISSESEDEYEVHKAIEAGEP
jgi:hypothetical protein